MTVLIFFSKLSSQNPKAMRHVHRNDTVGQVNPETVLKRWDSSGNI